MPIAFNEGTGETVLYLNREKITKKEAKKMYPDNDHNVQGTEAWHQFRREHIGASQMSTIMNVAPKAWGTLLDLWNEKVNGTRKEDNPWMARGREMEPEAREKYEHITGVIVFPRVMEHPEYPFISASFDGVSIDGKRVVEIKNPGKIDHATAKEGRVPKKYVPQLMTQMDVLGVDKIDYFSYRDGDYALITIERDDEYIKDMIQRAEKFWDYVVKKQPPPVNEDTITKSANLDPDLLVHATEQRKHWESVEKKQKALWTDQGQEGQYGRIRVSRRERLGAVQYNRIPQMMGVDVNLFRADPTHYWNVEILKE